MMGWSSATRADAFHDRRGSIKDFKILFRLFGYATPYRGLLTVGLITMGIYTFAVVAMPWIVQVGVDEIISDTASLSTLNIIVALFFGNAVVQYISHYIHQVIMARASQNLLVDLRDDMFSHLQDQSMSFYDKEEMGRIMSRIQNDVNQVQEFLTQMAMTIGDLFILGIIVIAMLVMDWQLALITMSVLPPLIIMVLMWQSRTWPRFMQVRRTLAVVNGNLQENISGMRVIQSLNREDENYHHFADTLNKNHMEAQLSSSRLSAALMPTVEVLAGTAMALVIVFGGLMVIDGGLQIGIVVAFALYIQRFFEPIRFLTMQYTQLQRALTSSSHIFELMDNKPQIFDKPSATDIPVIKGRVAFEDVHFSYEPGVEVLKGINLTIEAGETVAVVGATGAGKTTLSSLMLRLYDVSEGRVTVDGYDVRDVARTSLANQIGTVTQEPFLFTGSIKDNIRFSHRDVTDEQIMKAAKMVGAHDFISRMDEGYDSRVDEKGGNFSSGQRQLIALARSLVFDPRIIILDEATASVDSYTEMLIQEALGQVLKDRTALVIAHRLSTIRSADRIIVMDQGRIVEEGNHEQLMKLNGIYARLYRMNFGDNGVEPLPRDGNGSRAAN